MSEKKLSKKKIYKIGAYSVLLCVIVLAVVIALNFLVGQLPASIIHIDSTSDKMLTIGNETKEILDSLEDDVTLYHIVTSGKEDTYIGEMLKRYAEACSHVKVEKVDPISRPTFTQKYTSESLSVNSIIVASENRSTVIVPDDIYMYEISGYEGQYISDGEYNYLVKMYSSSGYTVPSATRYFFAENAITGAVDYVRRSELPVMYALSGHGETDLSSGDFAQLCVGENVELKSLALQSGEKVEIPGDATSVIINVPTSDISVEECEALKAYIAGGGTVLLTTSYQVYSAETMPNIAALCKYMGLEAIEMPIFETDSSFYKTYVDNLLPKITGNGITSLMSSTNYYFYMPASHALTTADTDTAVETYSLLNTSEGAYAYTEENAQDAEKAKKMQYSLAYQSVIADDGGNEGGSLIWLASPYAFGNEYARGTGNGLFFTAVLQKTAKSTTAVSLIGKGMSGGVISTAARDIWTWTAVACAAVPIVIIAAGFTVWFRRRRR